MITISSVSIVSFPAPTSPRSPAGEWLTALANQPGRLAAVVITGCAVALVVAVAVVAGRGRLHTWRHRRWTRDARWVTVATPPQVDPGSAAVLWQTLTGVLTPDRWTRILFGTAHVAWEYVWTGRRLDIRVWVPGTIPPGAVEAAVAAAWPGATWTTTPAAPPIPPPAGASTTNSAGTSTPAPGAKNHGTENRGMEDPGAKDRGGQGRGVELVEAGGAWWPQDTDVIPLRTDHTHDPLRALLAAGAGLTARDHACVQILARPAHPARIRAARRTSAHHTGTPSATGSLTGGSGAAMLTGLAARLAVAPLLWLLEVFLPGRPTTTRPGSTGSGPTVRDPLADARRRTVIEKVTGVPHYEIAIRYAVATHLPPTAPPPRSDPARSRPARHDGQQRDGQRPGGSERRRRAQDRLTGLAHTLASAAAAYTRPNRLRRMRMAHPVHVLATRRLERGFLATVEELAVLAGLPTDEAVPGLDRARAAAVAAPVAVPAGGRGVKVIGRAQVGGQSVALAVADARQHLHLIGKTGAGKSTLLLNMILSDVHARRGAVVIDPRGDLILDILDRLPLAAAGRVHIIDPDQPHPACFNPLDTGTGSGGGDVHLAVDNLVGIFSKIFQRHWGPRMDDILRVSCLTLMRYGTPTLALVPPLLNDRTFRARFTTGLTDPEGLGGFWQWYDAMNDAARAQTVGAVQSRLRAFLLRDFVKNVIGTATSSFDMADILDGGLLLCRLPKGLLGEDTARILGSLIVARTWQAAIARAAVPEPHRRDATLYIDEAQNFLTLPGSVEDMLAEARGFRLGLVLAHQNLAQLPAETLAALSANARSKIYFTVDPDDAKDLAKHTLPELSDHDLAHLDARTAAARLLVDGRELPAFTFTTNPPPPPLGHAAAIRAACATRNAGGGQP